MGSGVLAMIETEQVRLSRRTQMAAEVRAGLLEAQPTLSPKWFYDARGSELFDAITQLPEYYLTRTEKALLEEFGPVWIERVAPATLVELGAGSGEKTRVLLGALPDGATYVPVDISATYLNEIAEALGGEFEAVDIVPAQGDITRTIPLPSGVARPVMFAFLGSTIGNFESVQAVALLQRVRAAMQPGDALLIGADLRKDARVLEAAYNDRQGVTAEFNRNILRVLNRELGANFDLGGFAHRAFYDAQRGRIEMHLVARAPQAVAIPDAGDFHFAKGASIRTEISTKYDRATLDELCQQARLRITEWATDTGMNFAIALVQPA